MLTMVASVESKARNSERPLQSLLMYAGLRTTSIFADIVQYIEGLATSNQDERPSYAQMAAAASVLQQLYGPEAS